MRTLGVIAISLVLFMASSLGSVYAQSGVVTATVRPNPLVVSVSAPGSVVVGQWFDVTADITNSGGDAITQTIATLNTPPELKVKGQRKNIRTLSGGETRIVTWQVKADAAGSFVIQAEVTGNLAGEPITSSDSQVISAIGSLGAFLRRLIFGA